jgi:translation initiation factor 5
MATMNIAGLTPVNDPAYRYKMPRMVGKVEGRGNGIKTVLMNVKEVADSLKRDAPEVTKFFGCELGAQTTYAVESDRAVVNGAHRDIDLQTHLNRYIEHFVLCRNCRLPETHYKIKEGIISQKCLACGHKESVDMTHKLTTFILAQYKKSKEASKGDKKDKEKKKTEKKADKVSNEAAADKSEKDKGEKEKKKISKKKTVVVEESDDPGKNVFSIGVEEEESDSKAAGKHAPI